MQLIVHTDGGSLNNPGQAAIGFLLHNNSHLLYQHSEAIGIASNNVAEYTALIRALSYIKNNKLCPESIQIVADSQLMIKQMRGEYKVKHPEIRLLYEQVKQLVEEINCPISYTHVLRERNMQADALVKAALK